MLLTLALLLALSQTSPPVPGKAPNKQTSTAKPTKDKAEAEKGTPAQMPPPKETVAGQKTEDARKDEATNDKSRAKPIRDGYDLANALLSGFLVLITGFQAYLLFMTLKFLRVQTRATVTAARAASHNVTAARDNAKAAEEAAIYAKEGALAAKANAEAASANATTAKEQVEMFISRERAHIRVEMTDLPAGRQLRIGSQAYEVKFRIILYGPTDAFISKSGIHVTLFEAHPDEISLVEYAFFAPIWNIPDVISPTRRVIESNYFFLPDEGVPVPEIIETKKRVLVCHGFIEYKDVFERTRQTWFRYFWEVSDSRFGEYWGRWVKDGPPQDNRYT